MGLSKKEIIQAVWSKIKGILGTNDISEIGDGTVTGAISSINSNITLKTLEGTGCSVSYNSAIVLLGILVNNLNMNSNTTTEKIVLPSNVTPISGNVFITTDILNTAWGPQNVEAFLHFAPGQKSPNIRFDVSSVSGAVIAGTFAFPRDYFSIS